MLHVDRQAGTWRLLGSVVYVHRQVIKTEKQKIFTTCKLTDFKIIFKTIYKLKTPMDCHIK